MAIGAPFNDGNGEKAGHVRVYQNSNGIWEQIGSDIDGEAPNDESGTSVSLSSDGSILAIGAPKNDGNGASAGHVRIYELLIIPIVTDHPTSQSNVCVGENVAYSINGINIDAYQWQVSSDGGNSWLDLSDDVTYSGAITSTLTVHTDISLINHQYRCYLYGPEGNETSNVATLTFDIEDPVIISTHNDQIVSDEGSCEATLPDYIGNIGANDNCDTNLDIIQDPVAGSTISGSINPITLTVTDDFGNFTDVTFNVVVEDGTNPVITSTHSDQILDANENCEATLPDYTDDILATYNCDAELEITQNPVAGTIISGVTNTVTLTVTDDVGNFDEVSFNVEVIDNTDPLITSTHSDQTLNANENCEATMPNYIEDVVASDN